MDLDDFRMILSKSDVDVWTFIDTAIAVAAADYGSELKHRRDAIVEHLYASSIDGCRNCEDFDFKRFPNGVGATGTSTERQRSAIVEDRSPEVDEVRGSSLSPKSEQEKDENEEDLDPFGGLFDDEQTKVMEIKSQLEDPEQSEESLLELLQGLNDMDITFKALQETDIGRIVSQLRKYPSRDVQTLAKQLIRKWKSTVDKYVDETGSSAPIADGDSPQQNMPRNPRNGHLQVPEFGYSPNPHTGSSGSDKNYSEAVQKPKPVPKREPQPPPKPTQAIPPPPSVPPPNRSKKDSSSIDLERLNSARKRLHENYQEAQNAKKQRTIQVMDIHDIPKPKNAFFAKNKGGFQGRNHR